MAWYFAHCSSCVKGVETMCDRRIFANSADLDVSIGFSLLYYGRKGAAGITECCHCTLSTFVDFSK